MADLTDKQTAFVEYYLMSWNATEAARLAGYSEDSVRSIGSENLTKPDIRAAIDARLADITMSADEVLTRLTDQARSDIADFFTITERTIKGRKGKPDRVVYAADFDLVKLLRSGKSHLVKSVTWTKFGPRVELHDGQAALAMLGRYHKLFTDKVEHSGPGGGPVVREVVVNLSKHEPVEP